MSEPIVIVDYDPGWPAQFERIRLRVQSALGPLLVAVEHVGSTSVPGMAAKPIVDMDVAVAGKSDVPVAIERLAVIDYKHEGDLGITGREAFKPPSDLPLHHLYVVTVDGREFRRHIAFRNRLRRDPATAHEYEKLKRELAERFRNARENYSVAKTEFVERILAEELGASD